LEGGDTVDEFLRQFPSVGREQAIAALEMARDSVLTSARLLVPRPRINLILYHGVLAPRAAWRSAVVRRTTSEGGGAAGLTEASTALAP
jgi:hypothetical protein